MQRTLSIIKPDAVANGHMGKIIARLEADGFKICAARMMQLSRKEAEGFYAVHRERPFFDSLVTFMTSGPVMVMALEGEDAVTRYRGIMGATNPDNAEEGTIRKLYAEGLERNAVHGSDSTDNAAIEIAYFFRTVEQV